MDAPRSSSNHVGVGTWPGTRRRVLGKRVPAAVQSCLRLRPPCSNLDVAIATGIAHNQAMASYSDVLVAGAGPTGIFVAAELVRRGLSVRLIDKASGPAGLSKAAGLQARTLEIFEELGIVDSFLDAGVNWKCLAYYSDGERIGETTFTGLPTRYPFILSLPQNETEARLTDHLHDLGGQIDWQSELTELREESASVVSTLATPKGREEHRSRWLIGADGPHSTVRHLAGIDYVGGDYPTSYALGDVDLDWPDGDAHEAAAFMKHRGSVQIYSMPDNRWRIFVNCGPLAPGGRPPNPTVSDFQDMLDAVLPTPARVVDAVWTTYFMVHHHHARRFRSGQVFLAGDAAHEHSPISLQGMNAGIQDGWNLAWKLAMVKADLVSPRILDSYDAERRPIDTAIVHQAGLQERLTTFTHGTTQRMRDRVLRHLYHHDGWTTEQSRQIAQTSIHYHRSPIVARHADRSHACPGAGDRLPHSTGIVRDGAEMTLREAIRGLGHRLILFAEPTHPALGELSAANSRFDNLSAFVVTDREPPRLLDGVTLLQDPGQRIQKEFSITGPTWMLVRPDGYIACRTEARPGSLQAAIDHCYGFSPAQA